MISYSYIINSNPVIPCATAIQFESREARRPGGRVAGGDVEKGLAPERRTQITDHRAQMFALCTSADAAPARLEWVSRPVCFGAQLLILKMMCINLSSYATFFPLNEMYYFDVAPVKTK